MTEIDRALAIVPLSTRGFVALCEIAGEPPPSQQGLATRLGLTRGTTSELLKRLERRGLIQRGRTSKPRHGETQRRDDPRRRAPGRPATPVALTAAGRAVLADAERIAARIEDDWAARLAAGAGSPFGWIRAHGLRRWLDESQTALALQPSATASKPAAAK